MITITNQGQITKIAERLTTNRRAIDARQAQSALIAAQTAREADRIGDVVARDAAIRALWDAVGYWAEARGDVRVYRGDWAPPKMIRGPHGRAYDWGRRWAAVQAWAAEV